jgi:hypothetical protein
MGLVGFRLQPAFVSQALDKGNSSIGSPPEIAINLLEGFFHPALDPRAVFVEVLEPAQVFRPGFFLRRDSQLFLDSLGHELTQRDAALGGH